MSSTNGRRRKATPGDIRRYHHYRDQGLTIEDASRAVGFKKSWGYQRDQERREVEEQEEEHPIPAEDLSDAVALVIAERTEDTERTFEIYDRFGIFVVPDLCRLVWYLAKERANDLGDSLEDLFEGEPMADELAAAPITAEDILSQIPEAMRLARTGDPIFHNWMPPRAQEWMDRLIASRDYLADIDARARESLTSGNPEALKNLRADIWSERAERDPADEARNAEDDERTTTRGRG